MAKKTLKKSDGKLPSFADIMKNVDNDVEVLSESQSAKVNYYISTGFLALDAAISGRICDENGEVGTGGAGIPAGKTTVFSGEPQTGKSFLACSIVRQAQKMKDRDIVCIYMDSEGAITPDFCARLGIDTNRLLIKQVMTITEVSHFIANLCEQLKKEDEEYGQHHEVLLILDSLANLSSTKEKSDTIEGDFKQDFTKSKEIRQMFRVNQADLAKLGVTFVVVTHTYTSIGSYMPTQVASGGNGLIYNASTVVMLSVSKLQDKDTDESLQKKSMNAADVTRSGVLVTAKPTKSRWTIPHKTRILISYYRPSNIYYGLNDYMRFENSGVCRGVYITEKEYSKLSESEKGKVHIFEKDGEKFYGLEKDTARGIIAAHLPGEKLALTDFLTDRLFTKEFMKEFNEKVIRPEFELPNREVVDEDMEELESLAESAVMGDALED